MTFAEEMLRHACALCDASVVTETADQVGMRRAISALYYALFHRINQDAAALIAPNVPEAINYRIQRWFDHAKMKEICGRFLSQKLDQPLLGLIGGSASAELQTVCRNFVALQEARHDADYNLGYELGVAEALDLFKAGLDAIAAWDKIKADAEANIFILSLLLWKNWEKDR